MDQNYNPYSEDIAATLHLARKIAIDAGNSTIESEHILMAIIQMKTGGYAFLAKHLSVASLTIALRKVISQNSTTVAVEGNLPLSKPVSQSLIQLRTVNNSDSKDLLLALYSQKGCTASTLLDKFGFDVQGQGTPDKTVKKLETGSAATPALDAFSIDLTKMAVEGKLDPVVNRVKEINRIIEILGRRKKNNPILVGEPGVGKSAIVEGLAIKLAKGEVVDSMLGKRLVSLNMASVVSGTKLRGQFEERLKAIIDELVANKDIIVFIDEVHTLIGSGGPEGTGDAANMLKPALARGEIQCIGSTTFEDYRKYIERDPALERRFQRLQIEPPTVQETINILTQIANLYESYHKVKYDADLPTLIATLSDRFITDRYMPDKAIDILDESGSVAHLANSSQVTADTVRKVVSTMTGIPMTAIGQSERERLKHLEEQLNLVVVGQSEALTTLVKAVKRARTGLKSVKKPFSALLLGPTGVGKTETAKQLARCLFDSEDALIRVDMSELAEPHSIAKLIGSPPGYIGYEQGGQLTERVKQKPYSIILLDEVEKAHPEVFNIFLQVFDDGVLTDGRGKSIDFKNTIILMTSNIGTKEAAKNSLGFTDKDTKEDKDKIRNDALRNHFRPEFLNRIDEVVHYGDLTKDAVRGILQLYLKEIQSVQVALTPEATEYFITNGYSKEYGARPLRRLVQDKIESPIADFLVDDMKCDIFDVQVIDDKVVVVPQISLKEQEAK
jgi:ATP-dependent Clp protease ATP-binding subunit ClpC